MAVKDTQDSSSVFFNKSVHGKEKKKYGVGHYPTENAIKLCSLLVQECFFFKYFVQYRAILYYIFVHGILFLINIFIYNRYNFAPC